MVAIRTQAVVAILALTAAAASLAAQTPPRDTTRLESVVVTGSLLSRPTASMTSPITVLARPQLISSGATSLGDFLGLVPAVTGKGISAATNVNGRGTSTINLRGLEPTRTLVLINGRRLVSTNNLNASLASDLNNIPVELVERVEVLTGGASSAYGSDAVAGVINVTLRDHFDGAEMSAQTGASTAGDAMTSMLTLTTGRRANRFDYIASFGYFDRRSVYGGDRSLFKNFFQETGTPPSIVPGGSGNTGAPRADGLIIPTQGATARAFTIQDAFNTAPLAYLQTPQRRGTFNFLGSYHFSPDLTAFTELGFVGRHSSQLLGAFPMVVGPNQLNGRLRQLIRGNSFNTFPNAQTMGTFLRRFVEAGSRDFIQDADMGRAVVGMKGAFEAAQHRWQWETSYLVGGTKVRETITARPQLGRLADALDPAKCSAAANPQAGTAPCANLFFPGSLRPVDLNWIMYTDHANFSTLEQVVSGYTSSELGHLRSVEPVRVAFGGEARRETAIDHPDPVTTAGLSGGSQRDSTNGSYNVGEVFGELRLPLLANAMLTRSLAIETGVRFSAANAGTSSSAVTYRVGLESRVSADVRLRATASTAFRSPNSNELFLGKGRSYVAVADACANLTAASDATLRGNCTAQHVPLGMSPAFSTESPSAVGGNTKLEPEHARTWTAAADVTPRFISGLMLSAAWYNIDVRDPIGATSVGTIYDECYRRSNPAFCAFVSRDPANGQLIEVLTPYINQSFIRTSGLDLMLDQRIELPSDQSLNVAVTANYLATFTERALPSSAERSRVGYLEAAGGGFPRWRGSLAPTYRLPVGRHPLDLTWNTRYIGKLRSWRLRDAPTALNAQPTVSAFAYHDLSFNYRLPFATIGGGMLNLFDRQAPYYTGAPDTNTDQETYDVVGRRVFVQLRRHF